MKYKGSGEHNVIELEFMLEKLMVGEITFKLKEALKKYRCKNCVDGLRRCYGYVACKVLGECK